MTYSQHQREFNAFRDACVWLRNCFNIYNHLYDSGEETEKTLLCVAPLFFDDLQKILQEYFFLQVRKITDPAFMGRRANLSVPYIDQVLASAGLSSPEISRLSASVLAYRGTTLDIVNRVAAHSDHFTVLAGADVGAHPEAELVKFMESLQSYTDLVGAALGVGPLDYRTQAGPGDVIDLVRALKRV